MKWGPEDKAACRTSAQHRLHSLLLQDKATGRPDVGAGMVKAVT